MRTKEEYANWFRNSSTLSILFAIFIIFATVSFLTSLFTAYNAEATNIIYALYKTLYDPVIYVGLAIVLIIPIINLLFYGFNCIRHKTCPVIPLIPYISSFVLACLIVNSYTLINNTFVQHLTLLGNTDLNYIFVSSLPFTVIFLLYSAIFAGSILTIVIGFFMGQDTKK